MNRKNTKAYELMREKEMLPLFATMAAVFALFEIEGMFYQALIVIPMLFILDYKLNLYERINDWVHSKGAKIYIVWGIFIFSAFGAWAYFGYAHIDNKVIDNQELSFSAVSSLLNLYLYNRLKVMLISRQVSKELDNV